MMTEKDFYNVKLQTCIMTNESGQKIMDAALIVFAEYGYKGATIKEIAEKAGYSELTLFRKFKNKKNLFEMVYLQSTVKLLKDFEQVFKIKGESPEDFLRQVIITVEKIVDENFEITQLSVYNRTEEGDPAIADFMYRYVEFILENIPNKDVDHGALVLSIQSFAFMYNINKRHIKKRHASSAGVDMEEGLEGFIHNAIRSIRE
jgi:TetR/AcrR family transcriptional regulator